MVGNSLNESGTFLISLKQFYCRKRLGIVLTIQELSLSQILLSGTVGNSLNESGTVSISHNNFYRRERSGTVLPGRERSGVVLTSRELSYSVLTNFTV